MFYNKEKFLFNYRSVILPAHSPYLVFKSTGFDLKDIIAILYMRRNNFMDGFIKYKMTSTISDIVTASAMILQFRNAFLTGIFLFLKNY